MHRDNADRVIVPARSGKTLIVKAKSADVKKQWLGLLHKLKGETSSLDDLLKNFAQAKSGEC